VRGRIETAVPSPLLGVHRQAWLDRDRAYLNVTVVDVPSVGAFGVRAAGEGGHALLKRGLIGWANGPRAWVRNRCEPLPIAHRLRGCPRRLWKADGRERHRSVATQVLQSVGAFRADGAEPWRSSFYR
jgi:hypothetical protein